MAEPSDPHAPSSSGRKWRRRLFAAFSVVIFLFAAWVLFAAFRALTWSAVVEAISQWRGRLPLAAGLCCLSFAVVGVIEWRALRWAGTRVPVLAAFKGSFIANGFAHSLGASVIVAGSVRARLYARYGVGLTQSAAVTAFQGATSACGFAALLGVACILDHSKREDPGPIVGIASLIGLALYLSACAIARGSVRLWAHRFQLPHLRDAILQVVLGFIDNSLAIAVLWVLLPSRVVSYPRFAIDYVISYVGGALSGVPGGAGPFEGLLVKLLPTLDKAGLGAALLGFRLIFNLAPLIVAAILFAIEVVRQGRSSARRSTTAVTNV